MMLFPYFDCAVLAVLLGANGWYVLQRCTWAHGYRAGLLGALLFGLVLPWLSVGVDLARTPFVNNSNVDEYEQLYNFLTYPGYWLLFTLQLAALHWTPFYSRSTPQEPDY